MSTWEDENVHLPYIKVNIKTILIIIFLTHVVLLLFTYNMINMQDGYKLRKQILGQLLTLKENECGFHQFYEENQRHLNVKT
jgi:hypothetical protein